MTSIYPSSTSGSANSSTSSKNLLRISGIASGIDTDSVVKSMVSNYQAKIDKANQDKQTLQWKQEAYRDIIKSVKGLQEYFDPLSSKFILSDKSLNINKAETDDSSIVSATASSTAKAGTYNFKVSQLASQAKIEGSSKNSMINVSDVSKWNGNTLDFGSAHITLSSNISSIADLAGDINKQLASTTLSGKVSASYVNDGTNSYIKFVNSDSTTPIILKKNGSGLTNVSDIGSDVMLNSGISSTSSLATLGFSGDDTTPGTISFTLNSGTTSSNVSLTVKSSSTVQDLINAVKSATSGAVTMSIDDTTGKISFQSKSYGSASGIKITDSSGTNNIITNLGLPQPTPATSPISTTVATGTDAVVQIKEPGQSEYTTTTQSSNQFTINGVSYNLVGINDATNIDSNITVTGNSDTVVSNIKKFIDDYNSVISKINTKLTEKKNGDYPPLTDAQKESMSSDQITAWESKAKVGILRNDDYLNSLLTELRGAFSAPVYSNYTSSSSTTNTRIALNFGSYGSGAIGIDTSSTDLTDGGKIYVKDETKLKNAIENNMDDLKKLFIGTSDNSLGTNESYSGSSKYMEDGIFTRMDSLLRNYVAAPGVGEDGTYSLSGTMNILVNKQYDYGYTGFSGKNTLPDQVYSKTLNIDKLKTQMSDAETRYYNKFTALEKAMNSLNAQQSQLSSMLGTG
ncbi:flagellar filament capping protein FliD [Clostridium diolis]|uniref:flagellar filament capping protein FliD n=1 Tax=Clostridium diolis TaxID=223919 RepID=UPI003AF58C9E